MSKDEIAPNRPALLSLVLALSLTIWCGLVPFAVAAPEPTSPVPPQPVPATEVRQLPDGEITYPTPETFSEAVEALLRKEEGVPLPVRQRKDALLAYYVTEAAAPIWWRNPAMRADLINAMRHAEDEGLGVSDYPIEPLQQLPQRDRFTFAVAADLTHAASIELYYSAFFLKFASDIKVGRFLPTKVDSKLYWQSKSIDRVAALRRIAELGSMQKFIEVWQPQVPGYAGLKRALKHYREIEKAGGWPFVQHGEVLKPGMTAPQVTVLRARLGAVDPAVTAAPPGAETLYDDALLAAVKRFQATHGLDPDGIVGKQTLFQLNIPVEQRIRQIKLSMERWRWMPENLGDHYVMVNIAGYELVHIRNGQKQDRMRVVVGKPYHQTPVFSERMTYVEINPYWNVPHSIAVNEELPKLQSQPAAVAGKGFEVMVGDTPTSVMSIDWKKYSASNFPFRLRQKPGNGNALGRVKFMFPNQFNVYMHDTPARGLFSSADRARSHGCIRLARPLDMAEQVLAQAPGWSRQKIDEVVAKQDRTVVSLKQPLDVHITYSTAWRDEDGAVHFRPDIYQRDAKLHLALFGKPSPY
ncbi:Murein L,D-transpeptidase YcbB/YkuD [Filomicrobium insigne]|uniref:Murein L,D-transpeptidase YcbB/YkuD n=1 Tax=Filomicrobium insigne TaxID=418854 RepID=A0A1H0I3S4_9HYPH|nr:L,D-transpeptidase family protein [Filomicrobium insigne]SDO25711.1 Murein L,D-transpeptidase YcbB/YkuD [Filomicrobium insigne]